MPCTSTSYVATLQELVEAQLDRLDFGLWTLDDDAKAAVVQSCLCLPSSARGFIEGLMVDRRSERLVQRERLSAMLADPEGRGITQRTPEWYAARMDMITASDAAQALDCAKFGTQRQFFAKKVQQQLDGSTSMSSAAMPALRWGVMYEPVAAAVYMARSATELHDFGLLRHSELPFLGASPDGISDQGTMVEIKCPYRRKPSGGDVPLQYYYQIQQQLEVCGLTSCDFVECEIVELPTLEMLFDGSSSLKQCVQEHGVVLENVVTSAFVYSPLGLTHAELLAFVQDANDKDTSQMGPYKVHPFRVERYYCQRIRRDDDFLSVIIPQLEAIEARVLLYRVDKPAYDDYIASLPSRTRTAAAKAGGDDSSICFNEYAFLD